MVQLIEIGSYLNIGSSRYHHLSRVTPLISPVGRTKLLGFSLIKAPLLCATPVILGQGFLNVKLVLDMTKEFVYQCPDGRPSRRGAWLSRFRRCSGQQLLPEQKNENMHDGQKKKKCNRDQEFESCRH